MKKALILFTLITCSGLLSAQQPEKTHPYISLQNEISRSIEKGSTFLLSQQKDEGYWNDSKFPAYTAMALTAIARAPEFDPSKPLPAPVEKARKWLIARQKDDGGIYGKGLANYNTATSVMALLALSQKSDTDVILKARRFLINQQADFDFKGESDNKYDGGIGYGGTYAHSDLSNTHLALQAIKASEFLADASPTRQPKLDWDAALAFVSRCQNLTATNDLAYASDDSENKGGFIYYPGGTKAGEKDLGDGRVALRSYGSMSYAGLLSLVYAELQSDDPRLVAVKEWLGKNYTMEENPGLDQQGLFYYYNTLAKALSAAGIEQLPLANGKSADWRRDLGKTLINSQAPDGSWINATARWFENDPVLVTSYALMALENIHHSIPENIQADE